MHAVAETRIRQNLKVLIVEDERESAEWMQLFLHHHGYATRIASAGAEAQQLVSTWSPHVGLLDLMLPDMDGVELLKKLREVAADVQVIVVTGHASVSRAVEAMKAGALNFIEKPVDTAMLLAVLDKASEHALLSAENRRLRQRVNDEPSSLGEMVTKSERMRRVFELIKLVAPTDANVLITGDNGTGKELVADAIHQHSQRASGPFIKVNCTAIPSELIESELFGYKRGAFTDAISDKVGLFEQARGGTLLLDEIGEMPAHLQAKLLRVLQDHQTRPLGGHHAVDLDFRLVCATNTDLEARTKEGAFREDLYFRINTFAIHVPALRQRAEDVPLLADYFKTKFAREYGRNVTSIRQEAFQALIRHAWRGNVRELEHSIERAVIVASGPEIRLDDLPEAVRQGRPDTTRDLALGPSFHTLADIEKAAILRTLEHTHGNKVAAAAILGVYRPTLYSKLRKYGIGRIATHDRGNGEPTA
jgi:DNA-binding NtrC family response regulator